MTCPPVLFCACECSHARWMRLCTRDNTEVMCFQPSKKTFITASQLRLLRPSIPPAPPHAQWISLATATKINKEIKNPICVTTKASGDWGCKDWEKESSKDYCQRELMMTKKYDEKGWEERNCCKTNTVKGPVFLEGMHTARRLSYQNLRLVLSWDNF